VAVFFALELAFVRFLSRVIFIPGLLGFGVLDSTLTIRTGLRFSVVYACGRRPAMMLAKTIAGKGYYQGKYKRN